MAAFIRISLGYFGRCRCCSQNRQSSQRSSRQRPDRSSLSSSGNQNTHWLNSYSGDQSSVAGRRFQWMFFQYGDRYKGRAKHCWGAVISIAKSQNRRSDPTHRSSDRSHRHRLQKRQEIIRTTRSMRRLKPDPVPKELIRKILEAGVCAPSGGNMQRWRFLLIRDPKIKETVGALYKRAWDEQVAPRYRAGEPAPG